ncbi:autotransporter-associated N-terminal domain-containing protein [Fusobacterium pseudoperiodonticum]|uniref:autotransporter-associated N-terminal domain-containing protein n=1 Tax=Fusobacterium pseudoperiodonticum TaxID=2663009 RepID=UPI000C1C6F47|nr:autotransporter-associated N-terminal domain-containing protein [Fusobacterium pseudoperiodonticum]ATV68100.1 autotransporter domain-containing protein [Fusobacterium pseudoperiodonticum]
MENNLHRIEKDLRSIAKRYKSVKYSIGLAILFLMLGVSAFSEEVNTKAQVAQIATREELKTSVGDVQTKLNVLRNENKKEIENSKLELIQLMEQGDQVVKSPWASWQFGVNFFYENWGGTYKGRGDKPEKYIYNAVYTRGDWKVKNAMDALDSRKVSSTPLTPGNDSQASWIDILNTLSGAGKVEKNTAIYSSTNGRRTWGLVDLLNIKEPTNEVEILARISPKEVNKQAIPLTIDEPVVEGIEAPKVEPNVNTPLKAPEIKLPEISEIVISSLEINPPEAPNAPGAPTIDITLNAPTAPEAPTAPTVPNISVSPKEPGTIEAPTISITVTPPTITALNITTPPTVSVTPPTVSTIEPVAFSVAPTIDSKKHKVQTTNQAGIDSKFPEGKETTYTVNNTTKDNSNFFTFNAATGKAVLPKTGTVNVEVNDTRAMVIDEPKNGSEFVMGGTINLYGTKNMGIDLQGSASTQNIVAKIVNSGLIEGHFKDKTGTNTNKQQIAFGFSNVDASYNNTMSHIINKGTISLNAPESAAMQLKPEDPHNWTPDWTDLELVGGKYYVKIGANSIPSGTPNKGRVLMKADNQKDININSKGSFGIITVFNPGISTLDSVRMANLSATQKTNANLRAQRNLAGANILPGGEIGRSALADSTYTSGVYNTGTININGDESVGVGILHEIQEVKVGGTINIGTGTVNQVKNVSDTKSTATSDQTKVVNNAVGVFAGVPTLPVKVGENDTMGNKNTTGATIGTETTEANGKINLGKNATGSIGLLVGDSAEDLNKGTLNGVANQVRQLLRSGSITYKASTDGKITVDGNENYGFVVNSESYSSEFKGALDDLTQSKNNKATHGRGINEGKIEVVGTKSIGFALLKGGDSENTGSITVGEPAENSIGFYGEQDKFTNKGTIAVNTPNKTGNKAVLLKGNTTGITFENTGNISVNGNSNIGVYAEGKYTFNHEKNAAGDNKISVGTNAIGIYAKNAAGALNIKAPIDIAASGTGANAGTTIGIYSDGDAKVKFGDNSKLTIGEGAVGLYSSDATKFNNTFEIETGKKLEVELGKKSTFALLNGNKTSTNSPLLSKYLNNGTTDKIEITQFGEGASIFYATSKAKAVLDEDYTITNGDAASTSVLVANDGANVEVANGKTLKTNTNVGLIATRGAGVSGSGSVAENKGTIQSTRTEKGIGIYTTFAIGKNSGTITMDNKEAVGMLATIGSTLTNSAKIELKGISSAGMYGENSDLTNSGVNSQIIVNKEASAGMYAKMTGASSVAKTSKNEGTIDIKADGAGKSAAMYSHKESGNATLTTKNTKDIKVAQKASVGIYVKNESAADKTTSLAENTGSIKMTGEKSVGIIAEKSKVTNSGTGANGIEISGESSAGILATKESEVTNSGRIEGNTGTKLVGISVDETSTVINSGSIIMNTAQNTGIASKGGQVTNSGTITLVKNNSTGISAENADVINSAGAKIEVKDKESVGIYAKMSGNVDKKVTNTGTITLESPTGTTPNKSAAIYSLVDGGTGTGILTTENNETINVDQTDSVGIFAQNNGTANTRSVVKNTKIINVSKEGSAGILGEKSTITNSGAGSDGIVLTANKTVGIIGKNGSEVSNTGRIETKTATPSGSSEGLVGISLNASTGTNSGDIILGTAHSTGMNGVASSTVINAKNITGNKENVVGMAVNASTATNANGGTITLNGLTSTGIFGAASSTVTNAGKIETKTAVPTGTATGLVGIAVNASTGTNTGEIKIGTKYSTGMFGAASSTIINKEKITGTEEHIVGMAGNASIVTNEKIINLAGKNSTGLFGKNNSTLTNETNATITLGEEESVGIYSDANNALAINKGIINAVKKNSAGMLGKKGNIENTGTITTADEKSATMYTENANATNKATLNANGQKSAGIYAKVNEAAGNINIVGANIANATITITGTQSAGMLGLMDKTTGANSSLKLENSGKIDIKNKESVGMMVTNKSGATKDKVVATNKTGGVINLESTTATDNKNIGILANEKATGINEGTIDVKTLESVGMLGQAASEVINKGTISLLAEKGIGMLAKDTNSTAVNEGTIDVDGEKSSGMLAKVAGKVENKKDITVKKENGVGIFVSDTGEGVNTSTGKIALDSKNAVGIFAQNNGAGYTAQNAGKIILGKEDGTSANESLIGMFAQAEASKTASVQNTGTIDVNTKKSVGMYAKNDAANNVAAVDLQNTGTININNESSAGIYAPKATVSKVGTINLKNSDGSSAVYISKGGKVSDTASATINLGTVNQNRVAYYVNGAGSALAGANIGKISGYGVGVYLQGDTTPTVGRAEIDKNTPTLDFTTGDDHGDGIIGLYLNGNTEIKDYTKGITVGNSVGTNYAIGVYAKAQGTGGSYSITTPIKVGADGVGIYADKNSDITYTGDMEVGNGTKSGTGIYITKKDGTGTATGTVTLGSNTIKLKGTGGVAVIASEDTKFDAKNATIELIGKNVTGVGVYGLKGSDVKTGGWTFKNNGNQAEEVRLVEGKVHVTSSKSLNPRMVLTHVINGETSVGTGTTVTSVNDSPHTAKENIGLMAEGVKNPAPQPPFTWNEADFEAVNKGTIDFSIAERSTAIYVNSARAKNDGTIKVGKNSIAIYGFYDKNTRKYDGATGNPNKLEVETTAASKITLGDQSTGMYLINAEKIDNKGGEITSATGAKRNVGIYAVNGQDADNDNNKVLTMTTATKMTLGDGAVGIYSKGQSNTVRNTVTNTGDITVGDKIVASKTENYPAVAVYAENTNLTNTSAIRVGNDGIAYYGKNSTINANGSVDFSNKGVLAYLENSIFVSKLGNLGATQNTMLYLKDSTAQLDGAGTKVDIDVADGYTGAYISGNSHLTGVRTIKLGQGSTGLYLENTSPNFVSTAESISGTKDNARGIVAKNANFTNNSKISLSGKESVGIYSNADATKNVVNNGELTLSGKKTLGVFLRGGQTFENKANINIADSANSLEPTIGIYTAEGTSNIKHTTGTIEVGEKSIGIYSKTPSSVEMNGGKIHVKDQGIGIYKEDGTVVVKGELDIDKHVATAKDTEPTGVYAVNGATVVDQASKITVGEKSYGFILNNTNPNKTNVYTNTNAGPVSLGNDSVFLYSKGKANITNNRNINSNNSDHLIGFYVKDGGEFVNNGIIDFSTGKGNIGVYAPNGKATNRGSIIVGPTDDIDPATGKVYSDANKIVYGIGMAADNGGHIVNEGDIRISTNKSIGMYGAGAGTIVENTGRILLDGSQATATNKIQSLTGVYVDEGATFKNSGLITTTDSYAGRNGKINENVSGITGVAVMNGSTLINEATGKILIDADNSTGVVIRGKRDAAGNLVRNAVIKNYGEIKVRGKGGSAINWKDVSAAEIAELERQINSLISTDPSGSEITQASGTSKDYQGITITVKNGQATFSRNGVPVSDSEVEKINKLIGNEPNLAMSDIGFYIDTLGRTRPVTFDGVAPPVNSQLIIGTEFSEMTNKKEWIVSGDVIKPFLDQIQGRNFKITTMAGSLTWMATPILDNYGQIVGMAMSKLAYTSFVRPEDNAYNFADGLEQRYDMNALDSAEKRLFNKLNGIGKNEDVLLTQAYDEMMGHQYANVQQRIQATGRILDKEFSYLRNSWSNPSKDSNKVKTFGMKGEYKTDTAGIIDYKNNAYGVAYVHEDETVKLGESTGWYTGIVHNTFKFEDIGKSKEEQLQAKVGLFRSVPFDDNNSLNWTISGDIFVGHNKLDRRFLVVDEIFQAKSKYYTYGIGVKNEVGKEFRLSEELSVKPYGALRVEYGRMSKIKEKSGEMKLEVKSNDYLSIKPEVGTELAYKLHLGNKTLRAALAVAYENELGRVANGKNKARVAGTSADWFNIRGEKEDRRGNVKTDLNVGVDNQRIGVTGNIGYDTKGRNVRGGLGLRVIF